MPAKHSVSRSPDAAIITTDAEGVYRPMSRALLLLTTFLTLLGITGCTQRTSDYEQERQGSFYSGVSGGKTW